MNLFGAEERLEVPAGPGGKEGIRRALLSLFEFHKAEITETQPGEFQFSVPALVLSSRNKPLHRFQRGTIGVRDADDGKAEVYFSVLLSRPNIVSCVGSVALGLVIAAGMLATGETPLWWSLGAAAAGPLIAYTAKDQCVSRLRAALQEAATFAQAGKNR